MRSIVSLGLISLTMFTFAAPPSPKAPTGGKTAADVQKKFAASKADREKARQIIYERLGGLVPMPDKEPGILFLNCQKKVPVDALNTCIFNVKREFNVSCYAREGKFVDIPTFVEQSKDRKRNAFSVALVDDAKLPQMVAMPDNGCAIVNVVPLMADNPKKDVLNDRVWRMAYRAFAISAGAAWGLNGAGILRPADTLADLDANKSRATAPDAHFPIRQNLDKYKVATGGYVAYQDACFDGWAPAPTNEVQRKIYEGVKNGTIKDE